MFNYSPPVSSYRGAWQQMANESRFESQTTATEEKPEPTDLSIGKIVAWIVGALTILSGVALLFTSALAGIIMLVAGLFALPPTNQMIANEFNVRFSRWFVVLGYLVLLMIAVSTASV